MDSNSNNNSNNNNGYISRMIRGITDANSIRPAVAPESIPQFLLEQNRDTNNINGGDFNSNYDTNLNSPSSQGSRASVKDPILENTFSENIDSNKNKLEEMGISFHNFDNPAATKIKNISNQIAKSSNSEGSNLNKSDNLSRKLKINNNPDILNNNNFKPETFFSKNKNNIDLEKSLYPKNIIYNRLQKNEIIKKTYEPTITINIGKITVRHTSNNDNKNIKNMTSKGIRNSNKLSLSDYLRKQSGDHK